MDSTVYLYANCLVRFSFTNNVATTIVSDTYSLNINFGGSNMYDHSNSKSTFLGLIYPTAASTYGYTTTSDLNNNIPVTIEYPNNDLITVNLVNKFSFCYYICFVLYFNS